MNCPTFFFRRYAMLGLLLFWLIVPNPACRGEAGKNAATLSLEAAKDTVLYRSIYSPAERVVSGVGADGAINVNQHWEKGTAAQWYIEAQRYGGDLVQAGVVRQDDTLIQSGLKALAWGFAKQSPDGSFPGTGDPFHSTSLFVEAAARAMLMLKASHNPTYASVLKTDVPKITAAARWLTQPKIAAEGNKHNQPYTHRRWILAAALGETAALSADPQMEQAAEQYAAMGLQLQQPDGVNPEKGSFDVSYQGLGILMACRYYLVCPDTALQERIRGMVLHGLAIEMTHIDQTGSASIAGSSRTGTEEGRTGAIKTVDYRALIQAYVFGSRITGLPVYRSLAMRIAKGQGWLS